MIFTVGRLVHAWPEVLSYCVNVRDGAESSLERIELPVWTLTLNVAHFIESIKPDDVKKDKMQGQGCWWC